MGIRPNKTNFGLIWAFWEQKCEEERRREEEEKNKKKKNRKGMELGLCMETWIFVWNSMICMHSYGICMYF